MSSSCYRLLCQTEVPSECRPFFGLLDWKICFRWLTVLPTRVRKSQSESGHERDFQFLPQTDFVQPINRFSGRYSAFSSTRHNRVCQASFLSELWTEATAGVGNHTFYVSLTIQLNNFLHFVCAQAKKHDVMMWCDNIFISSRSNSL